MMLGVTVVLFSIGNSSVLCEASARNKGTSEVFEKIFSWFNKYFVSLHFIIIYW